MEQKLKVAVIGCGGISGCHLEAYSKNPNVEIYALCDVNEKNLNLRGDQYHVERRYTNKDKMLAELPEIDAVSVCTWNAAHAECTIAALNAHGHECGRSASHAGRGEAERSSADDRFCAPLRQ